MQSTKKPVISKADGGTTQSSLQQANQQFDRTVTSTIFGVTVPTTQQKVITNTSSSTQEKSIPSASDPNNLIGQAVSTNMKNRSQKQQQVELYHSESEQNVNMGIINIKPSHVRQFQGSMTSEEILDEGTFLYPIDQPNNQVYQQQQHAQPLLVPCRPNLDLQRYAPKPASYKPSDESFNGATDYSQLSSYKDTSQQNTARKNNQNYLLRGAANFANEVGEQTTMTQNTISAVMESKLAKQRQQQFENTNDSELMPAMDDSMDSGSGQLASKMLGLMAQNINEPGANKNQQQNHHLRIQQQEQQNMNNDINCSDKKTGQENKNTDVTLTNNNNVIIGIESKSLQEDTAVEEGNNTIVNPSIPVDQGRKVESQVDQPTNKSNNQVSSYTVVNFNKFNKQGGSCFNLQKQRALSPARAKIQTANQNHNQLEDLNDDKADENNDTGAQICETLHKDFSQEAKQFTHLLYQHQTTLNFEQKAVTVNLKHQNHSHNKVVQQQQARRQQQYITTAGNTSLSKDNLFAQSCQQPLQQLALPLTSIQPLNTAMFNINADQSETSNEVWNAFGAGSGGLQSPSQSTFTQSIARMQQNQGTQNANYNTNNQNQNLQSNIIALSTLGNALDDQVSQTETQSEYPSYLRQHTTSAPDGVNLVPGGSGADAVINSNSCKLMMTVGVNSSGSIQQQHNKKQAGAGVGKSQILYETIRASTALKNNEKGRNIDMIQMTSSNLQQNKPDCHDRGKSQQSTKRKRSSKSRSPHTIVVTRCGSSMMVQPSEQPQSQHPQVFNQILSDNNIHPNLETPTKSRIKQQQNLGGVNLQRPLTSLSASKNAKHDKQIHKIIKVSDEEKQDKLETPRNKRGGTATDILSPPSPTTSLSLNKKCHQDYTSKEELPAQSSAPLSKQKNKHKKSSAKSKSRVSYNQADYQSKKQQQAYGSNYSSSKLALNMMLFNGGNKSSSLASSPLNVLSRTPNSRSPEPITKNNQNYIYYQQKQQRNSRLEQKSQNLQLQQQKQNCNQNQSSGKTAKKSFQGSSHQYSQQSNTLNKKKAVINYGDQLNSINNFSMQSSFSSKITTTAQQQYQHKYLSLAKKKKIVQTVTNLPTTTSKPWISLDKSSNINNVVNTTSTPMAQKTLNKKVTTAAMTRNYNNNDGLQLTLTPTSVIVNSSQKDFKQRNVVSMSGFNSSSRQSRQSSVAKERPPIQNYNNSYTNTLNNKKSTNMKSLQHKNYNYQSSQKPTKKTTNVSKTSTTFSHASPLRLRTSANLAQINNTGGTTNASSSQRPPLQTTSQSIITKTAASASKKLDSNTNQWMSKSTNMMQQPLHSNPNCTTPLGSRQFAIDRQSSTLTNTSGNTPIATVNMTLINSSSVKKQSKATNSGGGMMTRQLQRCKVTKKQLQKQFPSSGDASDANNDGFVGATSTTFNMKIGSGRCSQEIQDYRQQRSTGNESLYAIKRGPLSNLQLSPVISCRRNDSNKLYQQSERNQISAKSLKQDKAFEPIADEEPLLDAKNANRGNYTMTKSKDQFCWDEKDPSLIEVNQQQEELLTENNANNMAIVASSQQDKDSLEQFLSSCYQEQITLFSGTIDTEDAATTTNQQRHHSKLVQSENNNNKQQDSFFKSEKRRTTANMMLKMSKQQCKKIRLLDAETKKKTPNFGQVKSDQNLISAAKAALGHKQKMSEDQQLLAKNDLVMAHCRGASDEPYSLYLSNQDGGPEDQSFKSPSSNCLNNLARSEDFFKSGVGDEGSQPDQPETHHQLYLPFNDSIKSPPILADEPAAGYCQVAFSSLKGSGLLDKNTSFTTRRSVNTAADKACGGASGEISQSLVIQTKTDQDQDQGVEGMMANIQSVLMPPTTTSLKNVAKGSSFDDEGTSVHEKFTNNNQDQFIDEMERFGSELQDFIVNKDEQMQKKMLTHDKYRKCRDKAVVNILQQHEDSNAENIRSSQSSATYQQYMANTMLPPPQPTMLNQNYNHQIEPFVELKSATIDRHFSFKTMKISSEILPNTEDILCKYNDDDDTDLQLCKKEEESRSDDKQLQAEQVLEQP